MTPWQTLEVAVPGGLRLSSMTISDYESALVTGASAGIGFAVPSNTAKRIIPDLLKYGYVRRPWLGVEPIPTVYLRRLGLDIPEGMLISRVVRGATAAKAGLRGATRQIVERANALINLIEFGFSGL